MISVFAVVSALVLGQVPQQPVPATLDLDAIVRGIEKNQDVWHAQKSWMVRYTHSRERIDPPPGTFVPYGDNDVVNARKGSWAFLREDQSMAGDAGRMAGRQTWAIWKEKQYWERNRLDLTIQNGDPGPSNLFYNVWLYPMSLCRDSLADTFAIPEEAYQEPEGLWMELPRCLKAHAAEYKVRQDTEDVDGYPCHVVQRDGKDTIWIDTAHGFNVRRRRGFQPSGDIAFDFKASRFKEKATDLWLPERQVSIAFNRDEDPKAYRGRVAFITINVLREVRFNDVPDSLFEIPMDKDVRVHDLRKTK
jgi:hypothetical protein